MNIELINYLLDRFQRELADDWIVNIKDYSSAHNRLGDEFARVRYGYLYLSFTNGRFNFQYDLTSACEMYERSYLTKEFVYLSIKENFEHEWVRLLWKEKR